MDLALSILTISFNLELYATEKTHCRKSGLYTVLRGKQFSYSCLDTQALVANDEADSILAATTETPEKLIQLDISSFMLAAVPKPRSSLPH